jgi:hypothetical protein
VVATRPLGPVVMITAWGVVGVVGSARSLIATGSSQ